MMKQRKILIVDNDPKNLRILTNNFADAKYNVDEAASDNEAYEKIQKTIYDGILTEVHASGIDGFRLLQKIQSNANLPCPAIFFLTQKCDVWTRVKSFKLGAKDFIVKPVHVKEIVARVNLVFNRLERQKEKSDMAPKKFTGRLENLGLTELIEIFGIEKKTGVLALYSENNLSGRIFFEKGLVIGAACESLTTENAVYKMMPWRKGRFTMHFTSTNVHDEIGVSNLGLLLQGAKRMEESKQLLEQLPSLDAVLVTTSNFKNIIGKKELASDLSYFISLFDGERTLGRIIEESEYEEVITLKRISKLYELGFLYVLRDFTSIKAKEREKDKLTHLAKKEDTKDLIPKTHDESSGEQIKAPPKKSQAVSKITGEKEKTVNKDAEDTYKTQDIGANARPFIEDDLSLEGISDILTNVADGKQSSDQDIFTDFREEPVKASSEEETRSSTFADEIDDNEFLLPDFDAFRVQHPADALFTIENEEAFIELEKEDFSDTAKEHASRNSIPISEKSVEHKDQFLHRTHGSVLIFGTNDQIQRQILASLTENKIFEKRSPNPTFSEILWGTAIFKGGHLLNIASLSILKEFAPLADFFSESILGYIVLITSGKINWNYYGYLIKILREKFNVPAIIVIPHDVAEIYGNETSIFEGKLLLTEQENVIICNEFTPINSKRLVFALFESYYRQKQNTKKLHVSNYSHE